MFNSFPTIHIYELTFKDIISVKLEKTFLIKLLSAVKTDNTISEICELLENKRDHTTLKSFLKPSYKYFIPLDVVIKLCEISKLDLDLMEQSIVQYQTLKSRVTISNPILPLKVTPIFGMLLAHLIGDGNGLRFRNKRTVYSAYRQFNPVLRMQFLHKAEFVFGKVNYRKDYFVEGTKIYLPEVPTLTILNYYNLGVEYLLSKNASITDTIFSNRENCVAVLSAFIIDEGNIDSSGISIRLANKLLIDDLARICTCLGYTTHKTKKERQELWSLYIPVLDTRKLFRDYLKLKIQYPFLTMDYKERKLYDILNRPNFEKKSESEGATKNKIIDLLSQRNLKITELADKLKITRQGIRFHIKDLKKLGVIKTGRIGEGGHLCHLIKKTKFKESKRGRSKPIGKSKEEILTMLSKSELTTQEIAHILKIDITNVRTHLNHLKEEGKILIAGKNDRRFVWKRNQ